MHFLGFHSLVNAIDGVEKIVYVHMCAYVCVCIYVCKFSSQEEDPAFFFFSVFLFQFVTLRLVYEKISVEDTIPQSWNMDISLPCFLVLFSRDVPSHQKYY